jgi:hypothetical protein
MHVRRSVWFAPLGVGGGAFIGCYSAGVLHKVLDGSGSNQNPYLIAGAVVGAVVGIVLVRLFRRSTRSLGPDVIDYADYADQSSAAECPIDR